MPDLKRWLTFRPWQRHSLVLMVGGLVYILLGVSSLTLEDLSARQSNSLAVALNIMPMTGWGVVFIFSGLLSCLSSRWPSFSDTWGYMVLAGLSFGWSTVYFTGYIFAGANASTTIPSGLVWALMGFFWWAISGLVNPDKIIVIEVPNGVD